MTVHALPIRPAGSWPSVELREATNLLTDGTHYTPPDVGDGIPFLTVKDVSEDGLDFQTCAKISPSEYNAAERQNSAPRKGDVLFSKDGTVGKVHLVHEDRPFAVLSSLAILRPAKHIDGTYLAHFLRTPSTIDAASKKKTGSAIRRIILRDLATLRIPVPPLDEQRRIAAILDKADALRRKRKRAIELLDSLTQSIFLEMFGDPAENPRGFERGAIGDLLEETQYGTSAKAGEAGAFPILRMGNLTNDGRIVIDDLKFIDLSGKETEKYTVRKGDILFNRTNSADLVGKSAIFEMEEPFAFAGYLVRARTKSTISPYYVAGYLNSRHGKAVLRNMAKSIVGMANINAKEMASIPILIPDQNSQKRYVTAITAVQSYRERYRIHARTADALFSSLQHRVFSGQL